MISLVAAGAGFGVSASLWGLSGNRARMPMSLRGVERWIVSLGNTLIVDHVIDSRGHLSHVTPTKCIQVIHNFDDCSRSWNDFEIITCHNC
jgi:hypothetical protein